MNGYRCEKFQHLFFHIELGIYHGQKIDEKSIYVRGRDLIFCDKNFGQFAAFL